MSVALPAPDSLVAALVDELPVGIWVARAPGGEFIYSNARFIELMGTAGITDAAVGSYAEPYGIFTRDGQPYPEQRMPFVRALQEREVVVVDDITIHRPDRSRIDVRAFARPVSDTAGVITHVVIAFFDITREVSLAREREEAMRRQQRAQRLESIGTLVGGVAHDFNNLIFGIKMIATNLMLSEPVPERRKELELVDSITERAATLTRSLLGFARLGKHRAAPVALHDIVSGMRELLSRTLAGVQLEFALEAQALGQVVGDRAQLEQVLMNLVVNARDAVGGAGRVRLATRTVQMGAPPPDSLGTIKPGPAVVLEVADDGPGIAHERRVQVFEPYFSTKTRGPDRGTGLGLATVLGIVESHHGAIQVGEGLGGRGTSMRVYLPASAAPPAEEAAPLPARDTTPSHGKLLVVDDDDIVRRSVTRVVRSLGYEVLEAAGGEQAVELLKSHGSGIAGVLLDMVMPGLSGRATYLALRAVEPNVQVLLMSGYTMNEEVQGILDLGVCAFLSKPYSIDDLARELKQLTNSG